MTSISRKRIRKSLIIAAGTGFFGILGFVMIDEQPLNLLNATGSFCFGSIPTILVILFEHYVSRKYFIKLHGIIRLILTSLIYIIIISVILLAFVIVFDMAPDYSTGKSGLLEVFLHQDTRQGILLIAVSVFTVQFFSMLNSFLGKNVLFSLIFGTHLKPREVDRIFMFLDISDSTGIAEKIGHIPFLSLLRSFYFDLGEAVSRTGGEIYKYAGDGAIITWKLKLGKKNGNGLRCFFELKRIVRAHQKMYFQKYGTLPQFKAGAHFGTVVIGEIGSEKKEITYLGDVINTASRIEGVCSEYGTEFIISGELLSLFPESEGLEVSHLGSVNLRGKEQAVDLYSVSDI